MAVKSLVPVGWSSDCNGGAPRILFVSYGPIHLYLLLSTHVPVYEPRQKLVRGVWIDCGFTARLQQPTCIEQSTPGNTTLHSFQLPNLPAGTEVWYTIATSCARGAVTTSTPALKFTYPDCPQPPSAFVLVNRTTLNTILGDIIWETLVDGDPAMWPFANGFFCNVSGTYTAALELDIRKTIGSPTVLIDVWSEADHESITLVLTSAWQHVSLSLSFTTTVLPQRVHVTVTRIAGFGNVQWGDPDGSTTFDLNLDSVP